MKREIIDYIEMHPNCCEFCRYRRELYGEIPPKECLECGFLKQRNSPYIVKIPVFEE